MKADITKPTVSEVLMIQDQQDKFTTEYNRAAATNERRAEIKKQYDLNEQRLALYFGKKKVN